MFAKISNDFLDHTRDYMQFNSNIVLDSYYSTERKGGSSFIRLKEIETFWSYHVKDIFSIRPVVTLGVFTGSGLITPHVDGKNDSVSLNFYLEPNEDETVFYEKKDKDVKPYPNTNSYDVKQLYEIGRFKANKFDTYLLDVQKIHGIQKSDNKDRIFISYRWKFFSFDRIFKSLNTKKWLWTAL